MQYSQHKKHNNDVVERLTNFYAPHACVQCGETGAILCPACRLALPRPVPRCFRCNAYDENFKTCTNCRRYAPIRHVIPVTRYDDETGKMLITALKFHYAKAAAREIAACIAERQPDIFSGDMIITHLPTATSRVRQRGYDQARLIATHLANITGFPYRNLLFRQGQGRQVGVGAKHRREQLAASFLPRHSRQIEQARIILIDDVVTTGATLESAANTLKQSGAKSIDAAVFAQA
jgi:ComF family protein